MSHYVGDSCPGCHQDLLEVAGQQALRAQATVDAVIAQAGKPPAQLVDEPPAPVRREEVVAAERAAFDQRLDAGHGVPAVLRGQERVDGYQERSTLVRVEEPGEFHLHLVQAGDGRVWAVLNRSPHAMIGDEL